MKIGKKEKSGQLYKAILQLQDEEECYQFFQDLCTVAELRSMEQRFEVASCFYFTSPILTFQCVKVKRALRKFSGKNSRPVTAYLSGA